MGGKKVYEAAEKKCPHHALAADTLPPWVKKLEDLMCAQMRKGSNEQHCVEIVCGEVRKEINVPQAVCELVGKKVYEAAEKKCPHHALAADTLPPWVKKL